MILLQTKIGIIGCGEIAKNKHLPALSKRNDIDIMAYCDISEEKAIKTKKMFDWNNAKIYIDYHELLEMDLDAVYVLTPNCTHCEITVAAMESGKHVLCEKPMAITSEEAKEMVDVAQKTNRILTIGYQNRYRADSWFLKQACMNQELGNIYLAKAHALRRRAVPTWGVFLDSEAQGGGALIDIGTHALDLTLWMMDNYKPISVTGSVYYELGKQKNTGNLWGDWNTEKFTVEDSAFGFIKMENGATIILETSWALNLLDGEEAKTTLCGTKAGADMKDGLRINSVKYSRQIIEKPDFNLAIERSENDREQEIFIQAIHKKGEVVVKPHEAYIVTKILEAVYQSAKTGHTVYFEQI